MHALGQCISRMMVVDAEQALSPIAAAAATRTDAVAVSVAEDTGSVLIASGTVQSKSRPPQAGGEKEDEKKQGLGGTATDGLEEKQGLGGTAADGLVDVYPMALEFLSPAEIARLLPICRSLSDAGRTVLPSVLADELRPRLPTDLADMIDASPHRNDQWTKLAKEWRRKSFVRAGGGCDVGGSSKEDGLTETPIATSSSSTTSSSDDEESDSEEEESVDVEDDDSRRVCSDPPSLYSDDATDEGGDEDEGNAADTCTESVLEAFLSKPKVVECLIDGCDSGAFASWFLARDGYRGLADINHCLKGAYMAGTFDDETDEEGPYVTLTQAGLANGVGVLPEKYHDFAGLVCGAIEGRCEHYICAEINGRGGQTLCYPDGTPLIMWIDAEGYGVGPSKVSVVTRNETNKGHIDEIRKFAPRCTCPDCDEITVPRTTDYGGMNTTSLLMEEPHLAPQFLGCEKDSYGRMLIEEGSLDGLTFSSDEYPPAFGDGIFGTGEGCMGCDLPSLSSLNEVFEITLKAVSYHPRDGPSSITVLHRAPLALTHAFVKEGGEDAGTIEYKFQAKQTGEVMAAVSMYNVAKLGSFLNEPFECDSRPTSNQLWINYWDIDLFGVKDGGLNAIHMSRSDLLWKCGMLRGL